MEKSEKFTIEVTTYIKGIAIILMICNHLYPIPEFIFTENQYISIAIGSKTLAAYIGGFGKICVAIYTILMGIGLYHTYKQRKDAYKHTLGKVKSFYITYWLILFFVYIPSMWLTGVGENDFFLLIKNMIGFKTTYCRVAWYVIFYLELIVSFPIFVYIFNKISKAFNQKKYIIATMFVIEIISLVVLRALVDKIIGASWYGHLLGQYLNYLPLVLLGYYCAEYSLFEKAVAVFRCIVVSKWLAILSSVIVMGMMLIFRGVLKEMFYFNMDFIYATIVIVVLYYVRGYLGKNINNLFLILGKYSTELWFLHAIFFIGSPMIQKLAYWPRIDILILIWTIVILFPIAWIIKRVTIKLLK